MREPTTSLRTKPLANVGAEVLDFDINESVSAARRAELRSLLYEHGLLLFRNQDIDAGKQIEFSRNFGQLQEHPIPSARVDGHSELFLVEAGGRDDGQQTAYFNGQPLVGRLAWHQDLQYTGKPNHAAVLRAVVVPEEGGLTGFGDLALLYNDLDLETRDLLSQLEVTFRWSIRHADMRFTDKNGYEPGPENVKNPSDVGIPDFPDATYPAITVHPITGQKILKVTEWFLERVEQPEKAGLTPSEADDLLRRVIKHTHQSDFHYFHQWRANDMILWDNYRIMHCTTGSKPGVKRLMHRTTIKGEAILGKVQSMPN